MRVFLVDASSSLTADTSSVRKLFKQPANTYNLTRTTIRDAAERQGLAIRRIAQPSAPA